MFRSYFFNLTLASCVLLALAVLASAGYSAAGSDADLTNVSGVQQPVAMPKPDLIDDIIDVLDKILNPPPPPEEDAGLADALALVIADEGTLTTNHKTIVASILDDVEDFIDQIQDSQQYPNLTPANAGQPGESPTFTMLEECAEQCVNWAEEALNEANETTPDHAKIGYNLDSIMLALPQYRDLGDL
jgi:hypothetical protein